MRERSCLFLSLVAAAALSACSAGQPGRALPFYTGDDLTPVFAAQEPATTRTIADDFAVVDQTGAALRGTDLDGRIHVASFVFTRCAGICPVMVGNLLRVQAAFAGDDDVMLVSFSVDPAADTVARLDQYADDKGIDDRRWKLVTGDRRAIYQLARDSYRADPDLGATIGENDFLHTEKVFLVDGARRIRGVYDGTLVSDMERLIEDIRLLQRAG